ncbi:MAG TPA: universal stress protein [Desulfomonilaceae bacterium]|nr:universal stress protein [Desulfomonilaceae bacterium]HVN77811.1 universal stress protein [Terriglobia bacterium]
MGGGSDDDSQKKILFCTDFSENSLAAGQCACEYAKAFGASLAIVHVTDPWAVPLAFYVRNIPILIQTVVADQLQKSVARSVNTELESMTKEFRSALKEVKTYSRIGIPSEQIVRLAAEECIDLIVMGTHGRTGFRLMVLGSVAENVLRTAGCPVLIVRFSAHEPPGGPE